ncbi:hypothetical protein BDY19DRAFT_963608 [Irpex rosettiformis]|uniref:Uncharacterized protein n=1 Tax=Irpex rosettiformis TaxID=378272 RepID=A0ACB8TV37_9APHY|nr:hypothetical protein BDY19DRAFT_963608 [Irpex rosettiformis]
MHEGPKSTIYKGEGRGRSGHLATVTTAVSGEERLRDVVRGWWGTLPHLPESIKEKQDNEESRGVMHDDSKERIGDIFGVDVDEKTGECRTRAQSASSPRKSLISIRNYTQDYRPSEMVFVTFGDKALSSIGASMKLEENSVTINYKAEVYHLRLGENGEPSLYAEGSNSSQVMWVRPPRVPVNAGDGQEARESNSQPHAASVTFYPEVRRFLDAIIVALVVWEKRGGWSFSFLR